MSTNAMRQNIDIVVSLVTNEKVKINTLTIIMYKNLKFVTLLMT